MVSGVFLLAYSALLLAACSAQVQFGTITGWYLTQNLWMLCASCVSLTQLLAMPTAHAKAAKTGTSTSSTNKKIETNSHVDSKAEEGF